ncbi:MAG: response regulator [Paracoccaceae bacterium]
MPPVPSALPDAITIPLPAFAPAEGRLPLAGVTVLAVEDSRFACDALRLLCQRSGARLRRADTLAAARAHLRTYRPEVILVDLGLPDGRGDGLIRQIAAAGPDRPVLLATSGDPGNRALALAAGADGFLDKPIAGLHAFQAALLAHLPHRPGPEAPDSGEVVADPLALHDDLALAAAALQAGPGAEERRYLAGFLTGLARQTHDPDLGAACAGLADPHTGLQRLSRLLGERLQQTAPFRPGAP